MSAIKQKWAGNANAKFIDCVMEKRFSHLNSCLFISTYLLKAIFQNMIAKLGIGITTSIFGLALIAFWKMAFHISLAI